MDKRFHTGSLEDMRFLVTGGAGFIGSNLVSYLVGNGAKKVRVLDDLSTGHYSNIKKFEGTSSFEFIEGDISKPEVIFQAAEGVDLISHQAALGSVPRSIKDPISTTRVNVDGIVNVMQAAVSHNVSRVIYASSSSVYGDDPTLPKKEDNTGSPLSPYAASKVAGEMYAKVFANINDITITGLRYFNVFGPNQDPEGAYAAVIPRFISALINNTNAFIDGDGSQTRDFTYVDNVVQANIKALLADYSKGHRVVNVACHDQLSILELFRLISSKLGIEAEPLFRDPRAGDIKHSLADISKAQALFGYNPGISLSEGLDKTIAYFKKRLVKAQ